MLHVQVDAASSRIAAYLAGAAGVQPGSTVALLLGRGPLLVASLLGVLKAGAAYLTLDGSNKSHMQMMLQDACVQVGGCVHYAIALLTLSTGCNLMLSMPGSLHIAPVHCMFQCRWEFVCLDNYETVLSHIILSPPGFELMQLSVWLQQLEWYRFLQVASRTQDRFAHEPGSYQALAGIAPCCCLPSLQVVITQPDLQRLLPASIPLHVLLLHPDKAAQAAPCGDLLPPACLGAAGSMDAAYGAEEMDSWVESSMMAAEPGCVLFGAAGCSKGQTNGMLITHAGAAAAVQVCLEAATRRPEPKS
jgi:hypothetical protein